MPMVVNPRTGKKHQLSITRSRSAKKAATKRKGKHLSSSTRIKISKSVTKARKTNRTKFGRSAHFKH